MSVRSMLPRLGVVTLLVVGVGVAVAPAPASAAAQCSYDTLGRTLTVTMGSADYTTVIRSNAPYLDVEDVHCALLTEVNTVAINTTARPDARIRFDVSLGPLGPGNFSEADGSSEIEFTIAGLGPDSIVTVQGTSGNDVLRAGQYFNKTTGVLTGQINLNSGADGATQDVDVSFQTLPGRIELLGNDGDDVLSAAGAGVAFTGPLTTKTLLMGGLGANTSTGGYGDDEIFFQEEEAADPPDVMSGGGGSDTVVARTDGPATTGAISLDGIANDGAHCPGPTCNNDFVGADIENVYGSKSAEVITGNDLAQSLDGFVGNDLINGGGGSDVLGCGGGIVFGNGGGDTIRVSKLCNDVYGNKGRDTVTYAAQAGFEGVTVSADDVPGDGYTGWNSNVHSDIEVIQGTPYDDILSGSSGRNTLVGSIGADQLYGQLGADTLIPGTGLDVVVGGGGTDRLNYASSTVPISVDVASAKVTGEGDDSFTGVEIVNGSPLADTMTGSTGVDRFFGAAGNDTLSGLGGNDVLDGGDGDDVIDGGQGTDVCTQGAGAGSITNCE